METKTNKVLTTSIVSSEENRVLTRWVHGSTSLYKLDVYERKENIIFTQPTPHGLN
ncbi:hypothetical protein Hanom_Chr16g01467131 [Helianthus anomalus]